MFKVTGIFLIHIFAISSFVHAEQCDTLGSTKDVLACALVQAPEMQRAQTMLEQARNGVDFAAQRPNPELSGTSTVGKSLGDSVTNNNVDLAHTVELGGKRGSRIEKAEAAIKQAESEYLKAKEDTVIKTLKFLVRIHQIEQEEKTVDEALHTFQKINKNFSSRKVLGPENQVSYGVFRLAENDYRIRKTNLEYEKNRAIQELAVFLGGRKDVQETAHFATPLNWPEFKDIVSEDKFIGSVYKIPFSDVALSNAELELARSESWPNLKIGPSYQGQTLGPFTTHTFGVNVTLPLPIFNANGGGRDFARAGVARAEVNLKNTVREIGAERAALVSYYKNSIKVLSESVSASEMEKSHKSVDALYERGVVSSPLVIEAHRQMVDFTKNRNEQEMTTLETMWKLKALEGKLFEDFL